MFRKVLMLAACILLFLGQVAFAEVSDDDIPGEIRALKEQIRNQEKRINELEQRLSEKESTPTVQLADGTVEDLNRLALGGLNIEAGATFMVQGTDNANGDSLSRKGEDATDGSYSVDICIGKEFEDYGQAFLHMETGDGAGVEDELQVFSNVNRDADDSGNSVAVTEAWYEHYFQSMPAKLMAGKIDGTVLVDTNEYANCECTRFLGRIFRNSPTIEFPDNTGGLLLTLDPADSMEVRLLMMDGDNDWEDIADDGFYAAQANFKPCFFERSGNYRVLGWLSGREHTKWDNPTETKEEMYGFGISFDQELSDSVAAFLRYGWQDPDVYLNGESFSLERAWSAGLQFAGSGWGREDDILGIAVGQAIPSDKYKDAGSNLNAEDEGHFEAYYNYKVNDHLTMTPDVQVIWNPYGDDASNGNDTITVAGMRGQVDF